MSTLYATLCTPRQAPRRARMQARYEAASVATEPMGIRMPGKWARRGYATLGIVMATIGAVPLLALGILALGFVVFPE